MNLGKRSLVALATMALAFAPAVAQAATVAKPVSAKVKRAAPAANKENKLGGGTTIIAILAAAAIILGIVLLADDDNPTSP